MKIDEIKKELAGLSAESLQEKADTWRQELLRLRISAKTSHVKDYSEFKKLKKNIARAMTYMSQQG